MKANNDTIPGVWSLLDTAEVPFQSSFSMIAVIRRRSRLRIRDQQPSQSRVLGRIIAVRCFFLLSCEPTINSFWNQPYLLCFYKVNCNWFDHHDRSNRQRLSVSTRIHYASCDAQWTCAITFTFHMLQNMLNGKLFFEIYSHIWAHSKSIFKELRPVAVFQYSLSIYRMQRVSLPVTHKWQTWQLSLTSGRW